MKLCAFALVERFFSEQLVQVFFELLRIRNRGDRDGYSDYRDCRY